MKLKEQQPKLGVKTPLQNLQFQPKQKREDIYQMLNTLFKSDTDKSLSQKSESVASLSLLKKKAGLSESSDVASSSKEDQRSTGPTLSQKSDIEEEKTPEKLQEVASPLLKE